MFWQHKPAQLFAANQNKPPDIVSILVTNRNKLLRLFADFKTEKGKTRNHSIWRKKSICSIGCDSEFCYFVAEDEQFEADKAQVVKEIAALEPKVGL